MQREFRPNMTVEQPAQAPAPQPFAPGSTNAIRKEKYVAPDGSMAERMFVNPHNINGFLEQAAGTVHASDALKSGLSNGDLYTGMKNAFDFIVRSAANPTSLQHLPGAPVRGRQ